MRLLLALLLMAIVSAPHPAQADKTKLGWTVQFRQTTFDQVVFPVATATEIVSGFSADKASLFATCDKDGTLLIGLYRQFTTGPTEAAFRGPDGTLEVTFKTRDMPYYGFLHVTTLDQSKKLMALLNAADGKDIVYRVTSAASKKGRQGTLPSIGASRAFEIVRQNCPK